MANLDLELYELVEHCVYDPVRFVMLAFPWGEEDGPLAPTAIDPNPGPDEWQLDILRSIAEGSLTPEKAIQIAVASGHGIGKSALVAWIILWFMSTRKNPQIVVTANTKTQLQTKTWRELAKWHKIAINEHWFKWTATKFYQCLDPKAHSTWFASAIPWSENNSEAFAGTHDENVLVIFDEASNIPDIIWEVASGAMTTPGAMWVCFGNPTRNTGRFKDAFGKFRHRWVTKNIDSRTAKMANKSQIQQWIDDYGEDSDYCRRRVTGKFPRSGTAQLIPEDLVLDAMGKHLHPDIYRHSPKVLGVDVAWEGDDQCVVVLRQGRALQILGKWRELQNPTMTLANFVIEFENQHQTDATFIDSIGVGAGVVDRLRQLGRKPIPVNSSMRAQKEEEYINKRIEMWDLMREWFTEGAAIPDDPDLRDDLIGPEYGFRETNGKKYLESKKDMKARGLASPDIADALALTFAQKVTRKGDRAMRRSRPAQQHDPHRRFRSVL